MVCALWLGCLLHISLYHYHYYADLAKATEFVKCPQVYSVEYVSKITLTMPLIFYAIYEPVCFQLTNFSLDDCANSYISSHYHHRIGNINR